MFALKLFKHTLKERPQCLRLEGSSSPKIIIILSLDPWRRRRQPRSFETPLTTHPTRRHIPKTPLWQPQPSHIFCFITSTPDTYFLAVNTQPDKLTKRLSVLPTYVIHLLKAGITRNHRFQIHTHSIVVRPGQVQSVSHQKVYFSSNTKVTGRWLRSARLCTKITN
jgi:hypothetical protein